MTWLVWPDLWEGEQLAEAVDALREQTWGSFRLVAIGSRSAPITGLQGRAFEGTPAEDLHEALGCIDTELVGYLGPGIILHNRRTMEFLCDALARDAALTASAEILSVGVRSKGLLIKPVEPEYASGIHMLPGAVVPVRQPPEDFWVTRTALLREWQRGEFPDAAGRHYCSTAVTVSKIASADQTRPPITPPAAYQGQFLHTELVAG